MVRVFVRHIFDERHGERLLNKLEVMGLNVLSYDFRERVCVGTTKKNPIFLYTSPDVMRVTATSSLEIKRDFRFK